MMASRAARTMVRCTARARTRAAAGAGPGAAALAAAPRRRLAGGKPPRGVKGGRGGPAGTDKDTEKRLADLSMQYRSDFRETPEYRGEEAEDDEDGDVEAWDEDAEVADPYSEQQFAVMLRAAADRLADPDQREVEKVRLLQLAKDAGREVDERLDPRMLRSQRQRMLLLAVQANEPDDPLSDEEFEQLYERTRSEMLQPLTAEATRERLRKVREDWLVRPDRRLEPRLTWAQRATLLRVGLGVYEPFRKVREMYERFRLMGHVQMDRSLLDTDYAAVLRSFTASDELGELGRQGGDIDDVLLGVARRVGVDPSKTVAPRRERGRNAGATVSRNEPQRWEEVTTEDTVFPDEFAQLRDTEDIERFDPNPDRRMYPRCPFCLPDTTAEQRYALHYSNLGLLTWHVNIRGQIKPRRRTGVCSKHQRKLARQIKSARYLALMDTTSAFRFGEKEEDLAALSEEDRLLLAQSDEDWLSGIDAAAVFGQEGAIAGDERSQEEKEQDAEGEKRAQEEAERAVREMEAEKERIFAEFRSRPQPPLPGTEDADLTTAEGEALVGRVHPTTRWLEGQKRQFRRRYGVSSW